MSRTIRGNRLAVFTVGVGSRAVEIDKPRAAGPQSALNRRGSHSFQSSWVTGALSILAYFT